MFVNNKSEPVVALTPVGYVNYAKGVESLIEEVAQDYIQKFHVDEEKKRFDSHILKNESNSADKVLHVDDLTAITHVETVKNVATYSSRAFTRAREGDIVLATLPVISGYHDYMGKRLCLGNANYIRLSSSGLQYEWSLFEAVRVDEEGRNHILALIGEGDQLIIHPYMSSIGAWQIAELLSKQTRLPVKVLAPLPTVSFLANNKNHFLSICRKVCGEKHSVSFVVADTPEKMHDEIVAMSDRFDMVVLRYPSSATGIATELIASDTIKLWKGEKLQGFLKEWLDGWKWGSNNPEPLQIAGWEPQVLASPSAQLWIPAEDEAVPIVEEILDQLFMPDDVTVFNGSRVSQLPAEIVEEVKRLAFIVGWAFKKMGYVGRCSFDLVVTGTSLENDWTVKFIECNGRWGGGSTPMTLMNRIFVDHRDKPYLHRVVTHPGLIGVSFPRFLEIFDDILYDANTKKGWAVVYNLAMLESKGQIDLIATGETFDEAKERHESFGQLVRERIG